MRAFDSIDIRCGLWRAWHPVVADLPDATGGLVRGSGFGETTAAALAVLIVTAVVARLVPRRVDAALGRPYGPVVGRVTLVIVAGSGGVVALTRLGVPLTLTLPILLTVLALLGALFVLGAVALVLPLRGRFGRHAPDDHVDCAEGEYARPDASDAAARGPVQRNAFSPVRASPKTS